MFTFKEKGAYRNCARYILFTPPTFESVYMRSGQPVLETYRHNPVPHGKRPLLGGGASRHHGGSIHSVLQTDAAVCQPQTSPVNPAQVAWPPGRPASSLGDALTKHLSIPAPAQPRPPRHSVTCALGSDSDQQDPGPRGPTSREHVGRIHAASAPQP